MKLEDEEHREVLHSLYDNPVFFGSTRLMRVLELVDMGLAEKCPKESGETAYRLSEAGKLEKSLPDNEPEWLRRQSPTERAVDPLRRTEQDYLAICHERPGVAFGEYDNIRLIFDMVARGLLTLDESKGNRVSGLYTAIFPVITEAGRQALKEIQ